MLSRFTCSVTRDHWEKSSYGEQEFEGSVGRTGTGGLYPSHTIAAQVAVCSRRCGGKCVGQIIQ